MTTEQNSRIYLSETEEIIKKRFELRGYKCLRKGHPDFVFYKEINGEIEDIKFIEVKGNKGRLSKEQKEYNRVLKKLGFSSSIIRLTIPNIKKGCKRWIKKKGKIESLIKTSAKFGVGIKIQELINRAIISKQRIKPFLEQIEKEGKVYTRKINGSKFYYWRKK